MDRVLHRHVAVATEVKKRVALWRLWLDRWRQRRQLEDMDARSLADINLTRDQIHTEIQKPFWMP